MHSIPFHSIQKHIPCKRLCQPESEFSRQRLRLQEKWGKLKGIPCDVEHVCLAPGQVLQADCFFFPCCRWLFPGIRIQRQTPGGLNQARKKMNGKKKKKGVVVCKVKLGFSFSSFFLSHPPLSLSALVGYPCPEEGG